MSWEKVKLGDIADVTSSKRVFANQYVDRGIPFYRQKEIIERNNKQEISDPLFISQDLYDDIKKKYGVPQENDLLITGVGATLGIPYVIGSEAFYFKDGNLIWVKKFSSKADSKYIYYYMSSDAGQKAMWSRTIGAAQPALTIDIIKQYEIPLPNIKTQKRIADILSAYDNLIENNQKQIKLLEEAAQRLYKQWFIDLRYPGHETTKIVDGLPEGWKTVQIHDVCKNIGAGGTPLRSQKNFWENGNIDWFKTQELCDCWLFEASEKISEEGLKRSAAKMFPANSILMAIYASPTLGRLGILTKEACSNQAALCLQADESKVSNYWLYLKLFELRDRFNSIARGAGQQNISGIIVKETEITLPAYSVMENFTEMVKPFFEKQKILQLQNISLTQTRDRLLPKLMKNEI